MKNTQIKVRKIQWNKCSICGRFISLYDFDKGRAKRICISLDTAFTREEYENTCYKCAKKNSTGMKGIKI